MKAAVYYGPGDVRIEGVHEPGPPGPEEVVLQVKMGSLCGTDASQYKAATMVPLHSPHSSSGHAGPVILGHEVVGGVPQVSRGADQHLRALLPLRYSHEWRTGRIRHLPSKDVYAGSCGLR